MKHPILAASVLALVCASSQAVPTRYDFSYTGLFHTVSFPVGIGEFDPDGYLGGYFVGEDMDGNGVLLGFELTDLAFTTWKEAQDDQMVHMLGPQACLGCTIANFAYEPGAGLSFRATDMHSTRSRMTYSSAGHLFEAYGDYWESYAVTDATGITVSPVPGPATGAMLAAGLVGLAYMNRRKAAST
jgi:hypothetical protein